MAKQHNQQVQKDQRRQERGVWKKAESLLMSFDWWKGVPKSERVGDIVWESELRHMIDYLSDPNK